MNPFVKLNLDDEESLQHVAREAARFVRSGLGSIGEWIGLDLDVQEAILAAREIDRLEDARALAICVLDPGKALAEFSRPLDDGKLAREMARNAERAAAVADMEAEAGPSIRAISSTELSEEQAAEAGIKIE